MNENIGYLSYYVVAIVFGISTVSYLFKKFGSHLSELDRETFKIASITAAIITSMVAFLGLEIAMVNNRVWCQNITMALFTIAIWRVPYLVMAIFDAPLSKVQKQAVNGVFALAIITVVGLASLSQFGWALGMTGFYAFGIIGFSAYVLYSQLKNETQNTVTNELLGIVIVMTTLTVTVEWVFLATPLTRGLSFSLPALLVILMMIMISHLRFKLIGIEGETQQVQSWENLWELTPKEVSVVNEIRKGASNKEVADSLEISPHTVKNHLYNIYQKTRVHRRADLIHLIETPAEA